MRFPLAFRRFTGVVLLLVGWSVPAAGFDLDPIVAWGTYPACGPGQVQDEIGPSCPPFLVGCVTPPPIKVAVFPSCRHLGFGLTDDETLNSIATESDHAARVIAFLRLRDTMAWPPEPDTGPLGPYFPTDDCSPKRVQIDRDRHDPTKLDAELPGWRECMAALAQNLVDHLTDDPNVNAVTAMDQHLRRIDPDAAEVGAALDELIVDLEDRFGGADEDKLPVQQVLDRLAALP